MNGLNSQIRDRIEAFVGELTDLIRRTALDSVTEALGGVTASAPVRARSAKVSAIGAPRERGGKRTPDEIASTTRMVEGFIAQHPGQGVEQIAKALNVPTKELTLPIKKLIATKVLLTEGQKRATKYFPATGSGDAGTGAARAAGGRKGRGGAKRATKGRGRKRG
ncbi:MAG: DNA-binding protein [Polyangiaceae bacterium]|nr:DNA-binding protein [Polyangiaceae bacterium]